jgi:hypothetical protein
MKRVSMLLALAALILSSCCISLVPKPDTPSNVSVVSTDPGTVLVSWSSVGACDHYSVRYCLEQPFEKWHDVQISAYDSSVTVGALTSGEAYEVQVASVLYGVHSDYSDSIHVVIK